MLFFYCNKDFRELTWNPGPDQPKRLEEVDEGELKAILEHIFHLVFQVSVVALIISAASF